MGVTRDVEKDEPGRSFHEFREIGLLWLINRVVFHPRGFAIGFHYDDDGNVTGWSSMGDGKEPWSFAPEAEEAEQACFEAVQRFFLEGE